MNRRPLLIAGSLLTAIAALLFLIAASDSAAQSAASTTFTWTDNFDGPPLDGRWQWLQEDPSHWSLTDMPGFLRITTRQSFSGFTNLAYVPAPVAGYEMETRLLFTPAENYQFAGLYLIQDETNFLAFGRAYCNTPPPNCQGNAIYFDIVEDGAPVGSNYAMTTTAQGLAWLQVIRHTNVYSGFVSEDGVNWTLVGVHTATISPDKVGLSASNQIQGVGEIPADFDYFTLIDESLRLFLPLVLGGS